MIPGNILIVEDKPIYAASLSVQFLRWGFENVVVNSSCEQVTQCLPHLRPILIMANLEMGKCSAILKAGCPIIFFKINDGSNFQYKQPTTVLRNYSRLDLPCSMEELTERVAFTLGICLPVPVLT